MDYNKFIKRKLGDPVRLLHRGETVVALVVGQALWSSGGMYLLKLPDDVELSFSAGIFRYNDPTLEPDDIGSAKTFSEWSDEPEKNFLMEYEKESFYCIWSDNFEGSISLFSDVELAERQIKQELGL